MPMPRTTRPRSPRVTTLPPALLLFAVMADSIFASDTLNRTSCWGSSSSWNCVVMPPKFETSATPGTCFSSGMTVQRSNSDSSRCPLVSDRSMDAFQDSLARPIILDAVAEHERDERQAERALGAQLQQARRPGKLPLQ